MNWGGVISAGLGLAGSIGGGRSAARAANNSLMAQTMTTNNLINHHNRQHAENAASLAPQIQSGNEATERLRSYLRSTTAPRAVSFGDSPFASSLGGVDHSRFTPVWGAFEEDPGYQYRKKEATTALDNLFAARGLASSGAMARAVNDEVQGLASQEYGNWFERTLRRNQERRSSYSDLRNELRMTDSHKRDGYNMFKANTRADEAAFLDPLFRMMGAGQSAQGLLQSSASSLGNLIHGTASDLSRTAGDASWAKAQATNNTYQNLFDIGQDLISGIGRRARTFAPGTTMSRGAFDRAVGLV